MSPVFVRDGTAPLALTSKSHPIGMSSDTGKDSPTHQAVGAAVLQPSSVAAPKRALPPIVHKWNTVPCFLIIAFFFIAAYYLYVRITTLTSEQLPAHCECVINCRPTNSCMGQQRILTLFTLPH